MDSKGKSPGPSRATTKGAVDFPSGSNWGVAQLEILNFALQPENHSPEDLHWEHELDGEATDAFSRLKQGFGLPQGDWV